MTLRSKTDSVGVTHVPPRWASLARAAWLLAVAVLVVIWALGSYDLLFAAPPNCDQVLCDFIEFSAADVAEISGLGMPARTVYIAWTGFAALYSLFFFVLAGLIYWRRWSDWMGLLVGFTLIDMLGIGAFVLLLLTFPRGTFVAGWTWKIVAPLFLLLEGIPLALTASSRMEAIQPTSPLTLGWLALAIAMFGVALYTQIHRYRRVSDARERQQTKWVVFGFAGAFAVVPLWSYIGAALPPAEPSPARALTLLIAIPLILLFSSLLPLSLAISILRYRLFDIDGLINRTLVYSLLSGALVGAYLLSVISLQRVFPAKSQLAIVASTLLIAALFSPLRRRIQDSIDRRFYRQKYDAELILNAFASSARQEVDLGKLTHQLLLQVEQAMQPAFLSLWLTSGDTERTERLK